MDVTESQIERPKRGQKRFYSGKQKRHPLAIAANADLQASPSPLALTSW